MGDSEGRWRQEGPVVLLLLLLLLVWVVRMVVLCVDRTGHRDLVVVAAAAAAVVLMIVVVIVVGWGEGISSVDGQPGQTSDARDVHGSGLRRSLWTGTERSGGIGREDRRRVSVAVVLAVLVAVVIAAVIILLLLLLSWVCGECSGGASQRGERSICLLAGVLLNIDLLLLISWKRKRKRRGRRRSGQDQHERNRHDRLWLMM